jgi:hypothetical protein
MRSCQAELEEILSAEVLKMRLTLPDDTSPSEYRDWINENWADRFKYFELDHSSLPHEIVREVLRGLYRANAKNVELRGETTESHNGYARSFSRTAAPLVGADTSGAYSPKFGDASQGRRQTCKRTEWAATMVKSGVATIILAGALTHQNCNSC